MSILGISRVDNVSVEIDREDGKKIFLPPGTRVIHDGGEMKVYECPDRDIVSVTKDGIMNQTKNVYLGKPKRE